MDLYRLQDVQLDDLQLKQQYYQALSTGDVATARSIYNNNTQLQGKAVTADMLNQIVNAIISNENLYYNNVEAVLATDQAAFQLKVDNMIQMGDFDATVQYNINNFVLYNDGLYFCLAKPPIGTLPTNTTYWLALGLKGKQGNPSLGVNYVGAWSSGTTYSAKQMVVYQSDLYVAIQANQAQVPSTSTAYWYKAVDVVPLGILISATEPAGIVDGQVWFRIKDYLCFTANTANSTIKLSDDNFTGILSTPYYSTDGINWSAYSYDTVVTLANAGDKVYFYNTSGYTATSATSYLQFVMTGSIAASGSIMSLLNNDTSVTISNAYACYGLFKDCTALTTAPTLPATTLSASCYYSMFEGCTNLTTAPSLPATTLSASCYTAMFQGCTNLITIPKLVATTLPTSCYDFMFYGCTNIKLSETQTGAYTNAYRIPTNGTGTSTGGFAWNMFASTGGTFTSDPTINTTYYTSNTII